MPTPSTRRDFLKTTAAAFAATALPGVLRSADAPKPLRPNIIFMVSDELGYFEPGYMGNPNIKTPVLDRLAAEGVRFTQALAGSSVCAPTRCCLMTGKHSGHTSVRANDGGTPLRADEETVASMLKKAGYATGGYGKWGCGGRGSTGVPEKHGFDEFVGYYDQVHAHSYYPPYILRNSEEVPLEGNEGLSKGKTYSQYAIMDYARKFLRAQKDAPPDRRFFCYLPVTPPHGIFDIPDDDPAWTAYKDKDWPEQAKRYAAMVTMIDRQLGEVLEILKEIGQDKNTIIFFSGDNGGADYFRDKDHPRGFHGANVNPETKVEFRGHKGNLYEGGLRIPMLAWWPGKVRGGRASDLLWYFPDVMPTLAELAGAKAPGDLDGMSIVPELLGEQAAGRKQQTHEYLYWELSGQTAVRMGQWKAVRPSPKAAWELYDLDKDVSESKDLAAKQPEVLAKMKGFAQAAHEDVRPGTFQDRANHEKDRRAKFGGKAQPRQPKAKAKGKAKGNVSAEAWPTDGLIPQKQYKIVRVSSESGGNGKTAACAIDGDPGTWWHSQFNPTMAKHPHEIVIDLGKECEVRGLRYMARPDGGWNGAIEKFEFYVGDDPKAFGAAAVQSAFQKVKKAQDAACKPVRGRYVMLKILSEVDGNAWGSIAELGVLGQ